MLSHKMLLLLLDGKPHTVGEIAVFGEEYLTPEVCARNFARKSHNPSKVGLSDQVDRGKRIIMRNLVWHGIDEGVIEEVSEGFYRITEKGIAKLRTSGRANGKFWAEFKRSYESGSIDVVVVPSKQRTAIPVVSVETWEDQELGWEDE
jgi:hypothetical protein